LAGTSPFGTSPFGALWAENCPNFLAGKTEVFSENKSITQSPTNKQIFITLYCYEYSPQVNIPNK
jgi:hypothetical protein